MLVKFRKGSSFIYFKPVSLKLIFEAVHLVASQLQEHLNGIASQLLHLTGCKGDTSFFPWQNVQYILKQMFIIIDFLLFYSHNVIPSLLAIPHPALLMQLPGSSLPGRFPLKKNTYIGSFTPKTMY